MHISSSKGNEFKDIDVLRRYLVLQWFKDVLPEDISEFPPHRGVDFSIELVSGVARTSRAPYRMSTHELVELRL